MLNHSACERDSQTSLESELEPRMFDYFKISDPDVPARRDYRTQPVEELNTSDSSIERPQSQGVESSAATIPEMVEDALEIISQDGDYMERIGMDVRVQCILCSWAGPRFILEYHIRKEKLTD
ncbi:uncharacterized protein LOC114365194 [Ostrinia furnacalis]|uniref:uncharacterized protein LOC114365194 n=1 Tax=Ostrinia furnacalis TaxID=93504 RepID=UPI00103DC924|nr:uncharacterized protein LOC114365194 [Ostrinia furnacalis]